MSDTYNENDYAEEVKEAKEMIDVDPVPAGDYDAALSAIVSLGRQKAFNEKDEPVVRMRFLFELFPDDEDDHRLDNSKIDGKPPMLKVDVSLSNGGRYLALVNALMKAKEETLTRETVLPYTKPEGRRMLLGRGARVTVIQERKKNKEGFYSRILSSKEQLGVVKLHPKATVTPVRETFLFNPLDPNHVKIFEDKITYWTQKDIMRALNADQFPKELKAAWARSKEANKDKEKESAKDDDLPFEPNQPSSCDEATIG